MRIACECVVVEVRYVADRVAEVCRVAGHPVKVRRLSVESLHLFSEVCRVAGHPVESRRADCAVEVCRLTAEVRRLAAHPVEVSVSLLRCAVSLPILWRCTISLRVRNKQTNKQLNTPRTMAVGSRPYPWASTSIPAPSAA